MSFTTCNLSKDVVKLLLGMCQSDREHECIRYSVFKASGLSQTQVRKLYGFERMNCRSTGVENVLKHTEYIRQSI